MDKHATSGIKCVHGLTAGKLVVECWKHSDAACPMCPSSCDFLSRSLQNLVFTQQSYTTHKTPSRGRRHILAADAQSHAGKL
jgi:hypothetical protein